MPSTPYAIINAVIYTGETVLYHHAVVVEQGKIKALLPENQVDKALPTIDLKGANLTAGFIDLQLNGCGGVMVNGAPTIETLEIMQKTNLKSGTTSYLPTLITSSDEEIKATLKMMREYLKTHHNEALGLHLEGPYISLAKKGVHRPDYIREMSAEMLATFLEYAPEITKMTIAAENPTVQYVPQLVEKGIIVSIGHSNGTYQEALHMIEQGASFATHLHNAMSPISNGRDMGVVGAVLASDIYTGIIVDGTHVHFDNVKMAKALKGEKLCIVSDAVAPAGTDIKSFVFVGKTITVKEDGNCYDEFGSLGGANITMIKSIQNAVEKVGIPLEEALRMSNLYPARAIKVDDKLGSIAVGKVANLTAFNHRFEVIGTAVNGIWENH